MNILPSILLFLLGSLPFAIPHQYRPNPVFPSEATAFVLSLLLTLLAVIRHRYPPRLAATQLYWLLFAAFICLQLVFQVSVYYEFKLIPLLFVLAASGMSYALFQFREENGLSILTGWFLFGILIGASINTIIAFSQVYFSITSKKALLIFGGIGQRNMYGNYLMGGFISFIYFAHKYRLRWWLTILPLSWLAVSLAWSGSRAILLYISTLFIISLWMYWRKPILRSFCRLLLLGLILVIIAQLLTPYINLFIGWLTHHTGEVPTALDRLTANGGRRLVEWQKAWLIFKNHIWLGAGWGNFPVNSVRLHAQFPAFYQVIESVLFTHAHNSVLNIMAENGLFGSTIILGGFLYLTCTFCFQINSPDKLALLLILFVTVLHSLVEYPLWYFHFFAIFVVCLGLLVNQHWRLASGAFIRSSIAVYAILALTYTGWGSVVYYQLSRWQQPSQKQENMHRIEALKTFQQIPLIDFHAAITASAYIDAHHDSPTEILPQLTRLNRSRPYPGQLMDEAIMQARVGNLEAAHHLLRLGIYSYPDSLPYFERSIQQSAIPAVKLLQTDIIDARRIFPISQ